MATHLPSEEAGAEKIMEAGKQEEGMGDSLFSFHGFDTLPSLALSSPSATSSSVTTQAHTKQSVDSVRATDALPSSPITSAPVEDVVSISSGATTPTSSGSVLNRGRPKLASRPAAPPPPPTNNTITPSTSSSSLSSSASSSSYSASVTSGEGERGEGGDLSSVTTLPSSGAPSPVDSQFAFTTVSFSTLQSGSSASAAGLGSKDGTEDGVAKDQEAYIHQTSQESPKEETEAEAEDNSSGPTTPTPSSVGGFAAASTKSFFAGEKADAEVQPQQQPQQALEDRTSLETKSITALGLVDEAGSPILVSSSTSPITLPGAPTVRVISTTLEADTSSESEMSTDDNVLGDEEDEEDDEDEDEIFGAAPDFRVMPQSGQDEGTDLVGEEGSFQVDLQSSQGREDGNPIPVAQRADAGVIPPSVVMLHHRQLQLQLEQQYQQQQQLQQEQNLQEHYLRMRQAQQQQQQTMEHKRDRSHFSIPDVLVTTCEEEGEQTKYEHKVPPAKRRSFLLHNNNRQQSSAFSSQQQQQQGGSSGKEEKKGKEKAGKKKRGFLANAAKFTSSYSSAASSSRGSLVPSDSGSSSGADDHLDCDSASRAMERSDSEPFPSSSSLSLSSSSEEEEPATSARKSTTSLTKSRPSKGPLIVFDEGDKPIPPSASGSSFRDPSSGAASSSSQPLPPPGVSSASILAARKASIPSSESSTTSSASYVSAYAQSIASSSHASSSGKTTLVDAAISSSTAAASPPPAPTAASATQSARHPEVDAGSRGESDIPVEPSSQQSEKVVKKRKSLSRFSIFGLGKKEKNSLQKHVDEVAAAEAGSSSSAIPPVPALPSSASAVPPVPALPSSSPALHRTESPSSNSSGSSAGLASMTANAPRPPKTLPPIAVPPVPPVPPLPASPTSSTPAKAGLPPQEAGPMSPTLPSPSASSFKSTQSFGSTGTGRPSRTSTSSLGSNSLSSLSHKQAKAAASAAKKEEKQRAKAEKEMLKEVERVNKLVLKHDAREAKAKAKEEKQRAKSLSKTLSKEQLASLTDKSPPPPMPPVPASFAVAPAAAVPAGDVEPSSQQAADKSAKRASRRFSIFRSRRMKIDPVVATSTTAGPGRRDSVRRSSVVESAAAVPVSQEAVKALDTSVAPDPPRLVTSPPPQIHLDTSEGLGLDGEWTTLSSTIDEQVAGIMSSPASPPIGVQRQSSIKRALAKRDEEEERLRRQRNSIRRTGSLKSGRFSTSSIGQEKGAILAGFTGSGPASKRSSWTPVDDEQAGEDLSWVEEEADIPEEAEPAASAVPESSNATTSAADLSWSTYQDVGDDSSSGNKSVEPAVPDSPMGPMITITEPDSPARPREPRPGAVTSQLPRAKDTTATAQKESSQATKDPAPVSAPAPKAAPNLPPTPVIPHRRKRNADQKKLDQFVFPPRGSPASLPAAAATAGGL